MRLNGYDIHIFYLIRSRSQSGVVWSHISGRAWYVWWQASKIILRSHFFNLNPLIHILFAIRTLQINIIHHIPSLIQTSLYLPVHHTLISFILFLFLSIIFVLIFMHEIILIYSLQIQWKIIFIFFICLNLLLFCTDFTCAAVVMNWGRRSGKGCRWRLKGGSDCKR